MTGRLMCQTESLTEGNAAFLRQGLDLIRVLDARSYSTPPAHFQRGGVGAHFRHILDHYDCFFAGLSEGRVDYDRRERDLGIATRPEVAAQKIEQILGALARLTAEDGARALQVALDCGEAREDGPIWGGSSVVRELQFLVSHTVHHYAVIAAMLRPQGIEPGADFGVAPSTLKFEQGSTCAR